MTKNRWIVCLGMCCSLGLTLAASAKDIFVDNVRGDDRFVGAEAARRGAEAGPCRTIARALDQAATGDRIILAATGVPYRESITLQAGRHSGTTDEPFQIIGSGATLYGAARVPHDAWQHVARDIYRFSPWRSSCQLLFLDGRPAARAVSEPGDWRLPDLHPHHWCLSQASVFFRTAPKRTADSYDLEYCALPVGITLYEVRNVVIQDLIVQGFQLDGINAHDSAFGVSLERVTCRGNARSGVSVGGASQVTLAHCLLGGNAQAQLRTEGHAHARLVACELLDGSAPAIRREGGSVEFVPSGPRSTNLAPRVASSSDLGSAPARVRPAFQ